MWRYLKYGEVKTKIFQALNISELCLFYHLKLKEYGTTADLPRHDGSYKLAGQTKISISRKSAEGFILTPEDQ